MGLDSEWSANVRCAAPPTAPRIGGEARVVPRQGFYTFAGVRFDITRGAIYFQDESPPDPRIDIRAETVSQGLAVTVTVTGNSSQPEIAFSSVPALPEEELLARMLFGDGVSEPLGDRRAAARRRGGEPARRRRDGSDQPVAHRDRARPAAHRPRRARRSTAAPRSRSARTSAAGSMAS